ncbi:MAG: RNA ligase (ATP) [Nostocales cyanobacterium LE14-WE12]|jgi:RNA ligase (TIGR02306 family)|nr:RNA ligase (ATP) [Nostocales cyanobacterium LE14-WE12]
MERKLATLEVIKDLQPIPGADNIEVATVRGWKVVVRKSEFEIGSLCVFFEIDSFLPELPEFEFLRKSCFATLNTGETGFRIRTVKRRKQLSQGLALPLSHFSLTSKTFTIGTDLTNFLGVKKWKHNVSAYLGGDALGNFPSFVPKTNEERIQNLSELYPLLRQKYFNVTEKLDGTSFTAFYYNDTFGVCSRNQELKESSSNIYWQIFHQYKIGDFLKSLPFPSAIQGEIVGGKIQGNPYKLPNYRLYVFNLINLDNQKRLDIFSSSNLSLLSNAGLDTVPLLFRDFFLPSSLDTLIAFSSGNSLVNPNTTREGLVLRNFENSYTSFKVISNNFLLKQKN